MNLQEVTNLCARAFIGWFSAENGNKDLKVHDKELIEGDFLSKVLLKKLDAFGIDIHLPDMLLIIISLCTNGNPGLGQVILKELLSSIKERKGPIPAGYVVTTDDFSLCFVDNFPILENPIIEAKYHALWKEQKYMTSANYEANACDTVEYWKEVME